MKLISLIISLIFSFTFLSGKDFHFIKKVIPPFEHSEEYKSTQKDTIILSKIHNPHTLTGDLDGDGISDSIRIVQNTLNDKYGLEIIFGNGKISYLEMGEKALNQDFDDFKWIGIFEIAPKNNIYWNNVVNGDIVSEDEVDEKDKIKLPNDGIYMHQEEACGGGIIYLNNKNFEWIQQD